MDYGRLPEVGDSMNAFMVSVHLELNFLRSSRPAALTAEFVFLKNSCGTAVRKYRYHPDVRYNAARSLRYASRGFVFCAFKTDYLSHLAIMMGSW